MSDPVHLLQKIESTHQWLIEALFEALLSIGHKDLADFLRNLHSDSESLSSSRIRICSLWFQLLNLAEENASNQLRRMQEDEGRLEPALLESLVRSQCPRTVMESLKEIRIEPVLTAHPTEARRDVALAHNRELFQVVVQRENQMYSRREQQALFEKAAGILERLWLSADVAVNRPRVENELEQMLYYLSEAFPAALSWMDERFLSLQKSVLGPVSWRERLSPRLRFGSWVGGDRDGHRDVTAHTTEHALRRMRERTLQRLQKELSQARDRLTLSRSMTPYPESRLSWLTAELERLGHPPCTAADRDEPFRLELERMRLKLGHATDPYCSPGQLIDDLKQLIEILQEAHRGTLIENTLWPLMRSVEVFGFHGASLDIRQNSTVHTQAFAELVRDTGLIEDWQALSRTERLEFLKREIEHPRPFLPAGWKLGPAAADVIEPLRVLARHHSQYGSDGLGAMIVSMTQSLEDLLVAALLQREAGLLRSAQNGWHPILEVVPLFETVMDLKHSAAILEQWLCLPGFAQDRMQIMIGYSDSAKDGGVLASQWNLFEAQSAIEEVLGRYGSQPRFFHGRGGTISRGAGPADRFLQALPENTVAGDFRVTEQGETIAQKYANPMNATYHLEVQVAGVCRAFMGLVPKEPPCMRTLMAPLAASSEKAYRELLETPGFIEFYSQVTPIDVLEHARIGSRASRRKGVQSLEDLRAIPWVFSWNQARFYLPSWFGVGTALKNFETEHGSLEPLQQLLADSPFVRYVLLNIDTGFASASSELMQLYSTLVENRSLREKFMKRILQEIEMTRQGLHQIFGSEFETRRPRLAATLRSRAAVLQKLHQEQVQLLRYWRIQLGSAKDSPVLERLLLIVNAIAAGERATG